MADLIEEAEKTADELDSEYQAFGVAILIRDLVDRLNSANKLIKEMEEKYGIEE